jgi:hypothetical protein
MQLLMPGLLADKDNTRNANNIDKALGCLPAKSPHSAGLGFVLATPKEIEALLQAVDFSKCSGFFNPFAGSGSVAQVFIKPGWRARTFEV